MGFNKRKMADARKTEAGKEAAARRGLSTPNSLVDRREIVDEGSKLLQRNLVANGTKRHFAAAQQTVAFGGKADIGLIRRAP
jgi:hypothetical protein